MTDASDMLAAALEQMDGIIAGNPRGAARPALTVPCSLSTGSLECSSDPQVFPLCPASPTLPVNSDILQQDVKSHFPPPPRLLIKLQASHILELQTTILFFWDRVFLCSPADRELAM